MARITVEDCLEKVDNQYDLVLLAKERTTQLNSGSQMLVEEDNDKRTIISLREIGDGKIDVKEVETSAIKRLRKEPDEVEQQEETEEEIIEVKEWNHPFAALKGIEIAQNMFEEAKWNWYLSDDKCHFKTGCNLINKAFNEILDECAAADLVLSDSSTCTS